MGLLKPDLGSIEVNGVDIINSNRIDKENALKKIAVTFQGVDIQKEKKINYGYRFNKKYEEILKTSLDNVDIFLSISENIKKDLLSLKVDIKKIFNISNSVYLKKFEYGYA